MSSQLKYKEEHISEESLDRTKVNVTNLVSRLNQEKKKKEIVI